MRTVDLFQSSPFACTTKSERRILLILQNPEGSDRIFVPVTKWLSTLFVLLAVQAHADEINDITVCVRSTDIYTLNQSLGSVGVNISPMLSLTYRSNSLEEIKDFGFEFGNTTASLHLPRRQVHYEEGSSTSEPTVGYFNATGQVCETYTSAEIDEILSHGHAKGDSDTRVFTLADARRIQVAFPEGEYAYQLQHSIFIAASIEVFGQPVVEKFPGGHVRVTAIVNKSSQPSANRWWRAEISK